MAEPYRSYLPGDDVFVRAKVVEHCSTGSRHAVAQLRIEDFPAASISITTFAPVSEIARPDDIDRLLKTTTIDPKTARR